MITSLLNGAKQKYKDESKDKGGDTENTPQAWNKLGVCCYPWWITPLVVTVVAPF